MYEEFGIAMAVRKPNTARPQIQTMARRISVQATRENLKRKPATQGPATYADPGRGPNGESSN